MTKQNGTGHQTPQGIGIWTLRETLAYIGATLAFIAALMIATGDEQTVRLGMAIGIAIVGVIMVKIATLTRLVIHYLATRRPPSAEEIARVVVDRLKGPAFHVYAVERQPADTAGHDDEEDEDKFVRLRHELAQINQEIARYEEMLAQAMADWKKADADYKKGRQEAEEADVTSPEFDALRRKRDADGEILGRTMTGVGRLRDTLRRLRAKWTGLQTELDELGTQTPPADTADHDDTPATEPADHDTDDVPKASTLDNWRQTGGRRPMPLDGPARTSQQYQPLGNLTPENLPGYRDWDAQAVTKADAPTDETPTPADNHDTEPDEHELLDSGEMEAVDSDEEATADITTAEEADADLRLLDELNNVREKIGAEMEALLLAQAKLRAAKGNLKAIERLMAEEAKYGGPSGSTATKHLEAGRAVTEKTEVCKTIEERVSQLRVQEADLIAQLATLGVTCTPIRFEAVVSDEEATDDAPATEPADHDTTTTGANVIPFAPAVPDRPHAVEIVDPMQAPLALLRTRLEPNDGAKSDPTTPPDVRLEMGTSGDLMIPQPFGAPTTPVGDPEPPSVETAEDNEPVSEDAVLAGLVARLYKVKGAVDAAEEDATAMESQAEAYERNVGDPLLDKDGLLKSQALACRGGASRARTKANELRVGSEARLKRMIEVRKRKLGIEPEPSGTIDPPSVVFTPALPTSASEGEARGDGPTAEPSAKPEEEFLHWTGSKVIGRPGPLAPASRLYPATPIHEVDLWSGVKPSDAPEEPDALADSAASAQWEGVYEEATGDHEAVVDDDVHVDAGSGDSRPAVEVVSHPTPEDVADFFNDTAPPSPEPSPEPQRSSHPITASAGWTAAPLGSEPVDGEE